CAQSPADAKSPRELERGRRQTRPAGLVSREVIPVQEQDVADARLSKCNRGRRPSRSGSDNGHLSIHEGYLANTDQRRFDLFQFNAGSQLPATNFSRWCSVSPNESSMAVRRLK